MVAVVLGVASLQLLTLTGRALVRRPTSHVAEDARLILDSEPIAVPVKDTSDRPVYRYRSFETAHRPRRPSRGRSRTTRSSARTTRTST